MLDARNGIERRQLLAWVREVDGSESRSGDPNCVFVHFAAERAQRLDDLAVRLDDAVTTEVVPVRLAWRMPHAERAHGPRLRDLVFGDPRVPGRLRATFILLRDRNRAHCLVGAAATIGDLRRRFASQVAQAEHSDPLTFAGFVARQAALTLDSEERGLHGSRYKAPRFVAESILTSVGFRAAVERIADEAGRPSAELLSDSRRYLREVVSTPSAFFLDLRAQFDRHFLLRGYERDIRCTTVELERLRALMRVHPTLLLFTHKTYADAALPGLLLYRHDMPMLHTFGGINLDLLGFGALMRRSGGIFIRRSFQDNPVYKLVLRRYIAYLLGKRFPMSWALEGTRSRLGKLMPPRYGLLKYTLDAAHEAGIENVHIVPFVTSFELIRDVEEYAAEQIGRPKQPESLRWLFTHFLGIRKPMGRVRVDLGEPVVVPRPPAPDDKLSLVKIALDVSAHANRVTPLTVTGVVCLVLLGTAPRGVTAPELVKLVAVLGAWARARGIRMSDELESDDRSAFFVKLDQLATSGLLIRSDTGRSVVYAIEPSMHAIASYYRNTIVHHFLHKAIIELALCKASEAAQGDLETVFWAETERLRELFKFEFFYPPRAQFRSDLLTELERTDSRWRAHLAGDSTEQQQLARRLQPFIGHAALLPYVEAYTVVLEVLGRLGPGEQLDQARCVALALQEGRHAYLLRRVSSEASIGKILFENGFKLATHLGLGAESTTETIAGRRALLQELRALSQRMERMRLEALASAEAVMASEVDR